MCDTDGDADGRRETVHLPVYVFAETGCACSPRDCAVESVEESGGDESSGGEVRLRITGACCDEACDVGDESDADVSDRVPGTYHIIDAQERVCACVGDYTDRHERTRTESVRRRCCDGKNR